MNKKITIIEILIVLLVVFVSGCVEQPIETLNRIHNEFNKADIEISIS